MSQPVTRLLAAAETITSTTNVKASKTHAFNIIEDTQSCVSAYYDCLTQRKADVEV